MKITIKLALLHLGLSLGVAAQTVPPPPAGLPPAKFRELQNSAQEANAAQVGARQPTAFGIAPERFALMQSALQEAHLRDGEIADVTERIDELMAQRDKLVLAAAAVAHPELKVEFDLYRKGQADLRVKSKAARQQRRQAIADGTASAPPPTGHD